MKYDEYQSRLNEIDKNAGRIVIKDYSAGTFSVLSLKALLSELKSTDGFDPSVIIIDYIGLMASSRVSMSQAGGSYAYFKAIAEELHGFGKKYDKAMFTAAQLNRCFAKGTLVSGKKIEDLRPGEQIAGTDGDVTVITKKTERQTGYKIKLKSGKEIIVSKNHRFPTEYGLLSIESGLKENMKLFSKNSSI